jgi:hypothetical protein
VAELDLLSTAVMPYPLAWANLAQLIRMVTTLDIIFPAGVAAGRRAEYGKTIEQQRDAMRTLLPEIFQASEARSKAELQRQLAAAGVRQNIITAANMLERSQQAAQQMGLNAASQAGSALTSQYQYQ